MVDREVRRTLLTVGEELRRARLNAGLTQLTVARSIGRSAATVSRVEQGLIRGVGVADVISHAAAVGLVARLGLYPAGEPVRDAAQIRLLNTFQARLDASWRWMTEVPLAIAGDLRAWDALIARPGCRIGIEAITRLGDIQAQTRSALLKARDSGVDRVILLVRHTDANRRALRAADEYLRGSFPLRTRVVLQALAEGRDPGASGIVVI